MISLTKICFSSISCFYSNMHVTCMKSTPRKMNHFWNQKVPHIKKIVDTVLANLGMLYIYLRSSVESSFTVVFQYTLCEYIQVYSGEVPYEFHRVEFRPYLLTGNCFNEIHSCQNEQEAHSNFFIWFYAWKQEKHHILLMRTLFSLHLLPLFK